MLTTHKMYPYRNNERFKGVNPSIESPYSVFNRNKQANQNACRTDSFINKAQSPNKFKIKDFIILGIAIATVFLLAKSKIIKQGDIMSVGELGF